jgi:hypothetical protein
MNRTSNGARRSAVLALAVLSAFAVQRPRLAGAHHVIGVTVTPTSINSVTGSVNVNVTESTTGTGSVHSAVGIHWGDAVTSGHAWTSTQIGPPNKYKVSLSHIYPDLTTRTILAVGDCCNASFVTPTDTTVIDFGCSDAPMFGCHAAGASSLQFKNNTTDDTKDKVKWKWSKGDTSFASLDDPTSTTQYFFCIYAPTLVLQAIVPSGASWSPAGTTGFKYADKTGAAAGMAKISLKSGTGGKAKIQVAGAGTNLPDPMPLTQPVDVQLQNSDGECWDHQFTSPEKKNTLEQFSDKEP